LEATKDNSFSPINGYLTDFKITALTIFTANSIAFWKSEGYFSIYATNIAVSKSPVPVKAY